MPPHRHLEIRWSAGDPAALAARLRGFGLTVDTDGVVRFPSATIRLTRGSGSHERLAVADPAQVPASGPPAAAHPGGFDDVLAIGLATVDRARAIAGAAAGSFVERPRDPHLGAWVLSSGPPPFTLVLEPDTEGRLAATLARHGEGPAAIYLHVPRDGLRAVAAHIRERGGLVSSVRPGPLGKSIILLGGSMDGPQVLVVEGAPDA